jgi:hypothetical protein
MRDYMKKVAGQKLAEEMALTNAKLAPRRE